MFWGGSILHIYCKLYNQKRKRKKTKEGENSPQPDLHQCHVVIWYASFPLGHQGVRETPEYFLFLPLSFIYPRWSTSDLFFHRFWVKIATYLCYAKQHRTNTHWQSRVRGKRRKHERHSIISTYNVRFYSWSWYESIIGIIINIITKEIIM